MKLLFTVNTYMPKSDGVQFVTKYLAEGLVKRGHKVDLITRQCKELTDVNEEYINGVHVIRWNADTKHTFHRGKKREYQKYIIENAYQYDCFINVGTQTSFVDWMLPIMDKIKCPKILYLHSIWDSKLYKKDFESVENICKKLFANIRWKIYYLKWGKAFNKFANVIQLHKFDYAYTFFKKKYGINSVVIENAAEEQFFDEFIDESIKVPNKYFLNVSNYMDRKNQMKILKNFLSCNISSDVELILIGSSRNAYYEKIVSYYEEYKKKHLKECKKVKFLYNIPREQIYTYVKKAYAYVMASKWEAYPISLIESMASGIPWISTDVGIVRYLPGGVIAKSDEDIKYWMEFIDNNAEIAEKMGKIGSIYANKQFKIEKKVEQLENVIIKTVK